MRHHRYAALLTLCYFFAGQLSADPSPARLGQKVTPATAGPYHVVGTQIVDSKGREFLMRGTQLVDFDLDTRAQENRSGLDFGGHSSTVLSAIRLRFNMNAVRLPVNALQAARPEFFAELAKVVRRANEVGLLVVLAARDAGATEDFWVRGAAYFNDNPNLVFDVAASAQVDPAKLVRAIRGAGARQPIVVAAAAAQQNSMGDSNVVYQVSPRYSTTRTDADRDAQFGSLAAQVPVLATGLDLELDDPAACITVPSDPAAASAMVQANLDYFDAHRVSWLVSVYKPGKLVREMFLQDATSLENGWTCGEMGYPAPGIGRVIEAHLRAAEERKLFIIGAGGGIEIARGGFALAYGPVMAQRDTVSPRGSNLPRTLGGITVHVTDSIGVSRPAGIYWASAGWGQLNFVVPPESAIGPAQVTFERWDGSRTVARVLIADAVPGIWTPFSCVGPAKGSVTQRFSSGRTVTSTLATCTGRECNLFPVPVAKGATTRVKLSGSGFRFAGDASRIIVTVGGVRVPVVSFGPAGDDGLDQITVEIPLALRGMGEADLLCHIDGRVSNAVRIHIGGQAPAQMASNGSR